MEFTEQDLSGARFARCLLPGAVIRGSDVTGMEIDDPHLHQGALWVNGVDVVPLVEAEVNRRFPGRELKSATTPDGLRKAWAAVEEAWAAVLPTAAGAEEVSVDGEWTFSQTLRHLVMATNVWLHGAVLGREQPFHWIGQPHAEYESDGGDMTIFREPASYDEVLTVRGEHQASVRDYLATVTAEALAETRPHPWAPEHRITVLHCLHVILNEEWQHLRVRCPRPPEGRRRLAAGDWRTAAASAVAVSCKSRSVTIRATAIYAGHAMQTGDAPTGCALRPPQYPGLPGPLRRLHPSPQWAVAWARR